MFSFGTGFAIAATYSFRTRAPDDYCLYPDGEPNLYPCGDLHGPIVSWFTVGMGFLIGLAILAVIGIAFAVGRQAERTEPGPP